MSDTTDVIFRRYRDGSIIALFPGVAGDMSPHTCSSYMRIGQHGAADVHGVVQDTKPATEAEYAALKRELEAKPYEYKLRVVRRATAAHRQQRTEQVR